MAELRVMAWNLKGSASPRLDAVTDLIRTHDPDVVALQEVRKHQAGRIAGLLGWPRPVWVLKHNPWWPLWWLAEGMAVLAASRLAPFDPVLLTPGVSRRSHRRRLLVPVELTVDGRPVLLFDAHLSSGPELRAERVGQMTRLLGLLPDAVPAIVAGDLNDEPESPVIGTLLENGFTDAWAIAGGGRPGATIPAHEPRRRIDFVLARGLEALDAYVPDDLGAAMSGLSDHRPVVASLRLS
ncbi:MAG TPA: endonuclease/exonuclease/phosphatase family protein [Acidimicrobiales bacterium]|jgi:endonuclease/exonuclease/phosphatase family metal-dependent hydrolase|nr:endonuclease/exonuclease/phosphatase family protein [Acidimicrobiales bacterium]